MSSLTIALAMLGTAHAGAFSVGPDPAVLAKAAALLARSDEILSASPSLKAKYTEIDAYPGEYRDLRQTATVELARPDELRVEITRARHVKAGEPWKDTGNNTMTIVGPSGQVDVFFHPHSTQVRNSQAAENAPVRGLQEAPLLSGFFSGKSSPSALLSREQADGSLTDVAVDGQKITFANGAKEQTVELGGDGVARRLSVSDRETGATRTWTLDELSLGATIDPGSFRYNAPADAIPYDKPARGTGLAVGSEAPDFQLTDSDGKTVRLSDLKGKPVVLKFWATWCWPCNQSLPETEALAKQYREQGVVTLAIAIKDSKTGFDAWVKKHPQYSDIRFLFEDPNRSTVSSAYKVRTTPTLIIVGRDGRIQTEIDGFTGPNPALGAAIEASVR